MGVCSHVIYMYYPRTSHGCMLTCNKYLLSQDKPWVYAHMMDIQRNIGAENFPLIEQNYYPDHRDMVSCGRVRHTWL